MANLFTIPQEIRDEIFSLTLAATLPSPSTSSILSRRDTREQGMTYNRISLSLLPITSTSLLLINRQFNAEVSALISRQKKAGKLVYWLDCLNSKKKLHLTWLSIPYLSEYIQKVYVDLRLEGCGGPSYMISSLFELLYRFLDRGPSFLGPQHQRRINVEEIVLNVVDWPEEVLARAEQENTLDRAHAERALRGREHSNHKPADVMLKIRNKIDAVEGSPKYPVSCRDAIDGRLGRIRLLLGGKEISMANFK